MREITAPVQSFGQFIKSRRLQLSLTQQEVAAQAKIAQSHLCKVENGVREPTVTIALRICDVLGLNINDFASEFI